MLRENNALHFRLNATVDLIINLSTVGLAFVYSYTISSTASFGTNLLIMSLIFVPIIYFIWAFKFKFFNSMRFKSYPRIILVSLKTAIAVLLSILLLIFVFNLFEISRAMVVIYIVLNFVLITSSRICVQIILRHYRKRGNNSRNVLLIGTGSRAKEFIESVKRHGFWGMRIIGLIDKRSSLRGKRRFGYDVLGTDKELKSILLKQPVDEVICAIPLSRMKNIQEIVHTCEELGITVSILSNFLKRNVSKINFTQYNGFPIISFKSTSNRFVALGIKRGIDLILASVLLTLSAPFWMLIMIVTKLTSPGPVFFVQERSGLYGRKFKLLKFRTMVEDAEAVRVAIAGMNDLTGPVFKIKNDPRVTSFGKLLRKTSLDELPQLINVIKNEMSLIGPRPAIPSEVENYELWQRRRLSMKPGITGLWQASGRNNIPFEKWIELDLNYIDNWCPCLDTRILLKTIPAVLFQIGAY